MIDDLYDSVLSITNKTGYLDEILENDNKSLLRWSSNNLFKHNINQKIYNNPKYSIKVFSHDEYLGLPFSSIIRENGIINNID